MRKQREGWWLAGSALVLLALIFLEPAYGWKARGWLSPHPPRASGTSSFATENEALKTELAKLQGIAAELPTAPPNYIRAMVYSRYPFNFKNEFLVNVGANAGVEVGKAAVFQGILVGTVREVFTDTALVQTPFDGDFKMPVRIGAKGFDALLAGGASPKAISIQKNAALAAGDAVYTAAPGVPYGLPIALAGATSTSPDRLFTEAALTFAYDINELRSVLIAK